jgi:Cof subfamily protein (haloacid dehalogenase superfamily)
LKISIISFRLIREVCYNDVMNLPLALFFDIDGTLLDSKTHSIPESTISVLNTLADRGYTICIASGRSAFMIKDLNLQGLVPWKYIICGNGHVTLDEHFNVIRQLFVPPETIKALVERADQHRIVVSLDGPDGSMLTREPDEYVFTSHAYYHEPIPEFKAYQNERIDKIIIFEKEDFDWSIFADLIDFEIKPTMTTAADVMMSGVSKHSAILDVLKTNNYPDYYIAFGDSMNDYEMLNHAPISVAMGNAVDEIKKIAHYVTDDVDQDGIAKMLKQLGYL